MDCLQAQEILLDIEINDPSLSGEERAMFFTHIDIGEQLSKGEWLVVLYRHDCPHCIQRLPKYQRRANEWRENQVARRIALIEMPPYVSSRQPRANIDTRAAHGWLDVRRD